MYVVDKNTFLIERINQLTEKGIFSQAEGGVITESLSRNKKEEPITRITPTGETYYCCPNCNNYIIGTDNYCWNCGIKLKKDSGIVVKTKIERLN